MYKMLMAGWLAVVRAFHFAVAFVAYSLDLLPQYHVCCKLNTFSSCLSFSFVIAAAPQR